MTKFSGIVASKIDGNTGKTVYSLAVNNYQKAGSTTKPQTTWLPLRFINDELADSLADRLAKVEGKAPHITITGGQLLTEKDPETNQTKTTLRIFNEEDVQKTVFEAGKVSSFNSVGKQYANLVEDFKPFGKDGKVSGMKGRVAINYRAEKDKEGNEINPCVFLNVTLFDVASNVEAMLVKGTRIQISDAYFRTSSYKRRSDGGNATFTEAIVRGFEVMPKSEKRESPAQPAADAPTNVHKQPAPTENTSSREINEDEIPF